MENQKNINYFLNVVGLKIKIGLLETTLFLSHMAQASQGSGGSKMFRKEFQPQYDDSLAETHHRLSELYTYFGEKRKGIVEWQRANTHYLLAERNRSL